jgi:hypothetical protein
MSEIKPKKERRFLKTLGRVGEILVEQVLLKLGSSIIRKIGGKKTLPSILFIFLSFTLFAQYPNTGNKQRLGFQTTGDGLTWRGSISDTASIQPINNQNAWVILDTINLKFYTFDFTSNVWNLVGGGGGAAFTQPVDSLFFNVNVPTNNVDTAKMRWDSDLATVVLGLNDNVPNELGFKNFWLVKNQTGATITKGSIVYANGTVGASGRITVAKFIANGSIDAKYLLGITAHDLTDGEDGYVISFGKIRQVNTDTFAAGAILYPSPTVAGVWTDVEPVAPNLDMPIGFCINSHVNNGTIAIRVASGYKLNELHDVSITSPVDRASLYYRGGLWRDTTEALLVSDTSAFARDNQISGTSGQVAYFNSSSSVVSDTALRWSAANKSLGINMTSVPSGANLIIKNSQEPVRTTVVANQTFGADTTNWTRGAGWTFNGTQAVATAATGDLTYTPALTITSGNAYEITYTLSGYSAGTLTARIGNTNYSLPTHNATANVVVLLPTSATGGFRFTTSTFTGNLDNVSVVQIANPAPILFAGQNDNDGTIYSSIQMPSASTIGFGTNAGSYATGNNNNFFGNNAGARSTTGTGNNFFGNNAGARNTSGSQNNFFGDQVGFNNTTGTRNNFFGTDAGYQNTNGSNNNFFGYRSGYQNTTGFNNNFFGTSAGENNILGNSNNFFGFNAGLNNNSSNNNFFGSNAGLSNTGGSESVFIGFSSGQQNSIGSQNTFIGRRSGFVNRRGNANVAIGNQSMYNINLADTLTGNNNISIGSSAADNIAGAAAGNVAIGNDVDLPTKNGSNQGVYQNVLFFTGASGTGTTIAAASKAGIKTNAPNRDLEVAGEVRITDLTTDAPTRLVGADADGDLGQVTLGAGLSLASSSLLADTNFLVTRFDTASMLTNYLRTGTAAGSYLPLAGGTMTGTINRQEGSHDGSTSTFYYNILNYFARRDNNKGGQTAQITFTDRPGTATFENNVRTSDIYLMTAKNFSGGQLGQYLDTTLSVVANQDGGRIGISKLNPAYKLDVNGTFNASGNSLIGGTLGVTGATTLSAPLTVNSSAVFNEGSADADFRVESDGNANMVFVDASTDRVGIGYASPTNTLDVNGTLGVFGATNLSNTLTVDGKTILNDSARFEGNILFKKNMGLPIVKISNADYTATTDNHTIIYTTLTSDKTLTIPNASDAVGVKFVISIFDIPEGNEALTLVTPSSNLFVRTDGENSNVDIVGGYCTTIQSDGTKWYILSYAPMY